MRYPKVSFIVCTYNSEKLIRRCLESIKRQNYPKNKLEILIIDGGSIDNTIKIAKEFGRVIHNPARLPEGKGAGKWLGFRKAKGEIVFFVDVDVSLVERDWIKKMIIPLMENKADISIARPIVKKDDKMINRYLSIMGTDPFASFCSMDSLLSLGKLKIKDQGKFYSYRINPKRPIIIGAYLIGIKRKTLLKCESSWI